MIKKFKKNKIKKYNRIFIRYCILEFIINYFAFMILIFANVFYFCILSF